MSLFRFGKKDEPAPQPKGTIITFKVEGMTCANCVRHVGDALRGVPGVHRADVDLKKGEAVVDVEAGKVTAAQLSKAVADVGYEARAV